MAALGISDAADHAFAAALQGVVAAVLGAALPFTSPATPSGRVEVLLLLHLRSACGVAGDADLPTIWEELARVKGRMEGPTTLK